MSAFDELDEMDFDFEIPEEEGLPPEGTAMVQVVDVNKALSKAGHQMLVWEFRIMGYQDPKLAALDCSALSPPNRFYTSFSPRALQITKQNLAALGVKTGDGKRVKMTFSRTASLGVMAQAIIKHEEFNNRMQANISALGPHPSGAGTKAPIPGVADPFADVKGKNGGDNTAPNPFD